MTDSQIKQCEEIFLHFGISSQIRKTREELVELLDELQHPIDLDCLASEIADVEIMLQQIKIGTVIGERVEAEKNYKLARTKKRMEGGHYESR